MTAADRSIVAVMDPSKETAQSVPPLNFIVGASRTKQFLSIVHADAGGMRLSPQPGEQSDDEFLLAHLGFLPPMRTRPRARAWISAAVSAQVTRLRRRQKFLESLSDALATLSASD